MGSAVVVVVVGCAVVVVVVVAGCSVVVVVCSEVVVVVVCSEVVVVVSLAEFVVSASDEEAESALAVVVVFAFEDESFALDDDELLSQPASVTAAKSAVRIISFFILLSSYFNSVSLMYFHVPDSPYLRRYPL